MTLPTPRPMQMPLFAPPASGWTAPEAFPTLRGVKRLGIDTEARDPDLKKLGPGFRRGSYLVGLSLAPEGQAPVYLPVRHEGGGNLDPDLVTRWAREELANFDGELVGANLLYELDGLATDWGVHFKRVKAYHDVQVAEPLLDENRYTYALDALANDYLGTGKVESGLRQTALAHGWKTNAEVKGNLWRLRADQVGPYAEADAELPLRILPLQLARIEAEELGQVYDVERRLIPVLLAMRRRGVRVDLDRAAVVRARLVLERDALLAEFRRMTACPRAQLMAPASFAEALWDRGLRFERTAKTKAPQIDATWMERNQADPAVACLWRARKVEKVISTFIDGHVLGHLVGDRVHCQFHQLKSGDDEGGVEGTIARFSSSTPNLQQIPARDPVLSPLLRSMFVPDEGEDWERQDASQIEYRFLAHFAIGSKAQEARDAYARDPKTDFHKMVASMMNVDPEDKIKRKRVKNLNFAKVYGAAAPTLAATFGCSLEEAERLIREYETKLPFVKRTFDRASDWAQQHGFVRTVLMRRRRFPLWEKRWGRTRGLPRDQALAEYGHDIKRASTKNALSGKLQGSSADLMKKTMVDAWDAGIFHTLGAPLLTVHDELDLSVPRTAEGQEAARELQRIGETCIPIRVPVRIECDRGENWGSCS